MNSMTMTGVDFTIAMAQANTEYAKRQEEERMQLRMARHRQMILVELQRRENAVEMHLLDYGQLGSPSHRLDF